MKLSVAHTTSFPRKSAKEKDSLRSLPCHLLSQTTGDTPRTFKNTEILSLKLFFILNAEVIDKK